MWMIFLLFLFSTVYDCIVFVLPLWRNKKNNNNSQLLIVFGRSVNAVDLPGMQLVLVMRSIASVCVCLVHALIFESLDLETSL